MLNMALMKKLFFLFTLFLGTSLMFGQEDTTVKGVVINATEGVPLESVNIVNINQVKGTTTNARGEFEIKAKATDTLHFSYLGFKSIRVRVTNDWIKFGSSTIELTELSFEIEEVVMNELNVRDFLEVDIQQVPMNTNLSHSISELQMGYEVGGSSSYAVTRVLGAVFNLADFLQNMFGKQKNELRKLKKMKQD